MCPHWLFIVTSLSDCSFCRLRFRICIHMISDCILSTVCMETAFKGAMCSIIWYSCSTVNITMDVIVNYLWWSIQYLFLLSNIQQFWILPRVFGKKTNKQTKQSGLFGWRNSISHLDLAKWLLDLQMQRWKIIGTAANDTLTVAMMCSTFHSARLVNTYLVKILHIIPLSGGGVCFAEDKEICLIMCFWFFCVLHLFLFLFWKVFSGKSTNMDIAIQELHHLFYAIL